MKNFTFFFILLLAAFFSNTTLSQHWQSLTVNGLPNSVNPMLTLSAVDSEICWGVRFDNSQFIRTTDGGTTWTVDTINGATGFNGSSINAINGTAAWVAMNDPSGVTSGGIFLTTNGGASWIKQNAPFIGSAGYPADIHFFDSYNGVAIGNPHNGNWEIYRTSTTLSKWDLITNVPQPAAGEFTAPGLYSSVNDTIWFGVVGGNQHSIYKSTNQGIDWSRVTNLPGGVGFSVAFKDGTNGLASNCFENQGNRIAKTTDGGLNFSILSGIPTQPSTYYLSYSNDPLVGYVVTSHNNIGLPETTFPGSMYSTDNGSSWIQIDNLPHGQASFSNDGFGWSGGINNIIYKWIPPTIPVEFISFNSSVIGNNIELTWQTATETNNQGFEIYRNGNKIAFVEGKGTTTETQDYSFLDKNLQSSIYNYRLNQLDFDGTQEVVGELTVYLALPEQFALEQNYPNPFNPTTTIKYSIPASEFITLKVYDLLGNEVATLVNEEKPVGSYEVEFNSHSGLSGVRELSSGIYFYKLQTGSFVDTKKMILMK